MGSMIHLNGHQLCAVDTETTGLKPFHHDLIQVCILPLDEALRPRRDVLPFYTEMAPRRPENTDFNAMRINKLEYCKLIQRALDADRIADLFDEWYKKLKLPYNKKIVPLAHNWIHDYAFIWDWLGWENMHGMFDYHYRDTMHAALFQNDLADHHIEQTPYPKVDLRYLCSILKVENKQKHDALADCLATTDCYRRILKGAYPYQRVDPDVLERTLASVG